MGLFNIGTPPIFTFNDNELQQLAKQNKQKYEEANPFPSIVIDDFLPDKVGNMMLRAFPKPESEVWLDWKKRNITRQPKKLGIGHASRLATADPFIHNVLAAFNSFPFLNFLEKLTGIKHLISDPYFHGGGLHQTLSGGKLSIHTDFNYLESLGLYRRINVILFLNKGWKKDYKGNLELWNEDKTHCETEIAPIFNRLALFETNKKTFHGHPEPLNTPDNITRKSLALYYYTALPKEGDLYDGKTDWVDT